MTEKNAPDGTKPRSRGPSRTSREDWIQIALDTLISDGVDSVKVLTLAEKLECARSSFYWFFKNRTDLLNALLDHWQSTNTKAVLDSTKRPAETINFALVQVYGIWVADGSFDTQLDFAIRDWARRSGSVRRALDLSDAARVDALSDMFERFGYLRSEAETRARITYFTQIGYDALDQRESMETRAARGRDYVYCITGVAPTEEELTALRNVVWRDVDT
ncbi:TetR/AcrR family transcriptional regulator [Tropicibacter sp. Alg240-R139]|uniref:TetR/AcrR family transcriptional regulator n=1 Tax=Tropicibacter sp. Alg240-R139 TaxID=2305991 RepID=UPI0013DE8A50|nr:TetR/AcrR family transcriptional regulator [Tropicibacter sp. Alg240-R139]